MKILEVTNYSAGIDGVWTRVKEEAGLFATKGHEVRIFSTNAIKGSPNSIAQKEESFDNILIKRFPARKLGGESFMTWDFSQEAEAWKPDVIIAHAYRHPHTLQALQIGKKIGARVYLVTHAPFVPGNMTRSFFAKLAVMYYDSFLGPSRKLKDFDGIIAITHWEIPYLKNLGLPENKIHYIPNGIPEDFFTQKKSKEQSKILFLGRIARIKNLETLIEAFSLIQEEYPEMVLELVGPGEKEYLDSLQTLVREKNLDNKIFFPGAILELPKKIKKIDSARIFVLPSLREAMPQALIEAMAREKIVIASKNPGSLDLIIEGKNGYLFSVGNPRELAEKIREALAGNPGIKFLDMKKAAKKSVEQFRWKEVITKWDALIRTS